MQCKDHTLMNMTYWYWNDFLDCVEKVTGYWDLILISTITQKHLNLAHVHLDSCWKLL